MKIIGRTHHRLISKWGSRWREVSVVMFTAYIDDSGTDPNQPIANATALIIPAKKIVALENEWNTLKEKRGFSCFHMSEFAARNGEHEPNFRDWDDDTRKLVFERVRSICKKYGVQVVTFTVCKKDYEDVVPEDFRKHSGKYPYTWALRHVLKWIIRWRMASNVNTPLEYVFDWMGQASKHNHRRREILDLMEEAADAANGDGLLPGEYASWGFGCRQEIPGLQCVDVLAWTLYQYGLKFYTKKPLHPDAKTAWEDFGKHNGGKWGFEATVKREELARWVKAETDDGRAIKKFEEREQRRLSEKGSNVQPRVRKIRCDRP